VGLKTGIRGRIENGGAKRNREIRVPKGRAIKQYDKAGTF
jgi:hypothetical protein